VQILPQYQPQDVASLKGSVPKGGGVYIQGLFMEGAAWDSEAGLMKESDPKVGFARNGSYTVQVF